MARGWESKSVAEQQMETLPETSQNRARLTPEQLTLQNKRQTVLLSRQRLLQQMQVASNPHHREMLQAALADLDAQLARLG